MSTYISEKMTVKDLFETVDFESVAQIIVQHHPELTQCLANFKMAFDGMRHTSPSGDTGIKVRIVFTPQWGLEAYTDNIDWGDFVSKEICIDDNVTASLNEIAATILLSGTVNGYTPDEIQGLMSLVQTRKWWTPPTNNNPYHKQWWKLKQREHDSLCSKEDIGTQVYEHPSPEYPYWLKPMNSSKRKRAYRWKKRIQRLRQLAGRWYLLQEIKDDVKEVDLTTFKDLLFKVDKCNVYRREDFSADGVGLPYIYDLVSQYDQHLSNNSVMTLLWFQSPGNVEENVVKNICAHVPNPVIVGEYNANRKRAKLTIVQLFG